MTNKEFDKKIFDVVAEEVIPFNEDNWAGMQQMLDKKSTRRLMLIPLLYKPYAAAATLLAVVGALYFFLQQEDNAVTNQTPITHEDVINHQHAPIIQNEQQIAVAPITSTSRIVKQQKIKTVEQVVKPSLVATVTDTLAQENNVAATVTKTSPEKNRTPSNMLYPPPDYTNVRHRRITLGINTGMALYQSYNSFAAGVVVKNRITERISLQAGLGFVQGRQDVSVKHVNITETPIIGVFDTSQKPQVLRTVTERYKEYSRNLPYIQFNPSVSVKIFKRLHGAVGVDIQRLIINKTALDTMNKHLGEVGKKVPETDAGITLNANYHITKNIGFGVSYRSSLAGAATNDIEYVKRSYFLMQLQYIFNAE